MKRVYPSRTEVNHGFYHFGIQVIPFIQSWRAETGRSFNDFYITFGCCPICAGRGITTDYLDTRLNEACHHCR